MPELSAIFTEFKRQSCFAKQVQISNPSYDDTYDATQTLACELLNQRGTYPFRQSIQLQKIYMTKQLKSYLASAVLLGLASSVNAAFIVRGIDAPTVVGNINQAESLLITQPTVGTHFPSVINYTDGGDAMFGGGFAFPGLSGTDDYALDAIGFLTFNTAGNYVFRVNSDDGFRLRLNNVVVSEFVGTRGPAPTDTSALSFAAGATSSLRLTFFERDGGDEIELSYSRNGGEQTLVGSSSDITVSATPAQVPDHATTFGLLSLSMASIMVLRNRAAKRTV